MLVGATSMYSGSWLEGSGAVYAENQALRWLADLAGLPPEAGGAFVQGGTIGNLSALVAARESALHRRGDGRPHRWAVCISGETHSSVKHALQIVMDVDVDRGPGRRARPADRAGAARDGRRAARDVRRRHLRRRRHRRHHEPRHRRRHRRHRRGRARARLVAARRRRLRRRRAGRAERRPPVRRRRARRLVHRRPAQVAVRAVRLLRAALPRPGAGPRRAHPARGLPGRGQRRGRVEPVRLRDPAHPPGPRAAVLVLPRRARHRRLHRGARADARPSPGPGPS